MKSFIAHMSMGVSNYEPWKGMTVMPTCNYTNFLERGAHDLSHATAHIRCQNVPRERPPLQLKTTFNPECICLLW